MEQVGLAEPGKRVLERRIVESGDGAQELVVKAAPERRAHLRHLFDRGQSVESSHQRILEGRGNGQRRQRPGELVPIALVPKQIRFEHHSRELFDEQGHPVGLCHDMLEHLGGQLLSASHSLDHRLRLPARHPVDGEIRDVTALGPGRPKLGTCRHEHQNRCGRDLAKDEINELPRGRVGPVQVFDDEQQRLLRGQRQQERHDGLERLLLLALRCEVQWRVVIGNGQGQERGPERHHLGSGQVVAGESRCELREPFAWRIVAVELERALEQIDQRIESAVLMVRRAATFPSDASLGRDVILQHPSQARLADPGLAAEQHDVPSAVLDVFPAVEEQPDFLVSSDQWCERLSGCSVERVRCPGVAFDPVHAQRGGQPLDHLCAQIRHRD